MTIEMLPVRSFVSFEPTEKNSIGYVGQYKYEVDYNEEKSIRTATIYKRKGDDVWRFLDSGFEIYHSEKCNAALFKWEFDNNEEEA